VTAIRDVTWDGFFNARDLSGLPTRSGPTTRFGVFIRSADLRFVTDRGWDDAREAGVRTIVDLRNADEIRPTAGEGPTRISGTSQFIASTSGPNTPPDITRVEVPLDDIDDAEFWQHINREQINGTPLYSRPFLERKAERCCAVIHELACAVPGGVLFHCGAGRDRTGLVALLVLSLADVQPTAVVEDYEMSTTGVRALFDEMGLEDEGPSIASVLAGCDTTARAVLLDVLESFDAEKYLVAAGSSPAEIELLRNRLVGHP
jgi:protein-tyrosine phosphatase